MKTADVAALIFELQRTRSPVERARVLARAWRTIRGLDPVERRLLAREVGFDGAEELLEGLAGRGPGGLAPAALLEALNRARQDDGLSMRSLVTALRDPVRRDEVLARGVDLAAAVVEDAGDRAVPGAPASLDVPEAAVLGPRDEDGSAAEAGEAPGSATEEPTAAPQPTSGPEQPSPGQGGPRPATGRAAAREEVGPTGRGGTGTQRPSRVPQPAREPREPLIAVVDPSPWDRVALPSTTAEIPRQVVASRSSEAVSSTGTVLERIRRLRASIQELRGASRPVLAAALADFPEPWARRRAMLALIEAGIPADPAGAVALVESELERPLDRRWCVAALARRGDLAGDDLAAALELLASPSARRRVEALARSSVASPPTGSAATM